MKFRIRINVFCNVCQLSSFFENKQEWVHNRKLREYIELVRIAKDNFHFNLFLMRATFKNNEAKIRTKLEQYWGWNYLTHAVFSTAFYKIKTVDLKSIKYK